LTRLAASIKICPCFEVGFRQVRQLRIDDNLVDVIDEGRPALCAEPSAVGSRA
jgi:hypothetical protein